MLKIVSYISLLFILSAAITAAPVTYTGVNLAGADFGENNLPGTYNVHYTYPTHSEVDYFVGKGMNTFRLPFRWERLQQSQNAAFNSAELARLDDIVNYATGKGAYVVLDPHNYARYYGTVIGQGNVPASAFADFWTRLANRYKTNNRVIFGLMNEPHDMTTELWRDDANVAISAIRATGATNLILVPGNGYTGAASWLLNWYGTPNGTVMLSITDPLNNFAFDVHQYLDTDSSGTSENCISSTIGSQRLNAFTNWLRTNNRRGFLGEFAGGRNTTCYAALGNMLDYMDANNDVWLGWTYWAAGPWWSEYIFTLEPTNCPNCTDRPQLAVLAPHFAPQTSLRRTFDFDGDGKADISVFRPSNGAWYISGSQNGFSGLQFGQNSDRIVPSDFDGDGKADIAVFRDGFWYYLKSSNNSFVGLQFGQNGDIPIPADFDGDGKSDITVFRPSNGAWYRLNSSNGSFFGTIFGQSGDQPLIADFDGDGKSDIAVFRPSTNGTFYSLDSSNGAFRGVAFGLGTDIPTLGDFDGDGKTDVAVFRSSNGAWYRLNSSNGSFFGTLFGQNGDIPVQADYDGDGKADIAVFRPSYGAWYYLQSTNGGFVGQIFGLSTDKPIPAAFQ